jgi:hypothetical protein
MTFFGCIAGLTSVFILLQEKKFSKKPASNEPGTQRSNSS